MRINLSPAWRDRGLALVAGLAAGLAHPPFGFLPGLLGFGLMLWGIDRATNRGQAFFRGWLSGVGYFSVSIWWIVEPFMVDAANQGWMAPFALLLMGGGLALFWGLAGLVHHLASIRGAIRVFVFAGCLAGAEWLRGHLFTGFPWDLPGEAWAAGTAPSQMAAYVGSYGLTWITIALGASAVLVLDPVWKQVRATAASAMALALVGLYGLGSWPLHSAPKLQASAPLLRLVQADIDQKEKWRPENLDMIFRTYVELSTRKTGNLPQAIIWPEGALPVVINEFLGAGSPYPDQLRAALQPGQTLMMGANRVEYSEAGKLLYFNSLLVISPLPRGLQLDAIYDKHRLVPFGEFIPLGDIASKIGLRSMVHMPEDFTAGAAPTPLDLVSLPSVQPLICYEALFPGFTRAAARRGGSRPAWILNVSNDAWFGKTSGPLQHLNMAGYRAIEEGLPIARVTPTGVTVMLDAQGRTVAGSRLGLGTFGIVDVRLPSARPPTPYVRFGDAGFALMLLVSAGLALRDRRRKA
jgi:apolipoprotein N-acyltransferase